MKNEVKLNNYYFPDHLKSEVDRFVNYYNDHRYHEALDNMTPSDIYFGRHNDIKIKRKEIKQKTLKIRRKQNLVFI